jgi:TonB-linked SusC/RagA family outer membrane protein
MMKKQLSLLFVLLLLLPCSVAWAQTGTVEGQVTDSTSGDPIPGANVLLEGTNYGASTDVNGSYTIEGVEPGTYTLNVSFVGFETFTEQVQVRAGETTTVPVAFQPSAVELETVTVTALGFREQRDELATATSRVEGEAVANSGAGNTLEGLQGKAAGVDITSFGGDPGAGARIQIRGQTTISGDNEPLIVVDGVPISNSTAGQGVGGTQQQSRLNDINPDDIASVEVLKGASAAALWGSRAQSGVVLVETKAGNPSNRISVSLKSSVAVDELNKSVPLQQKYGQGFYGKYGQGSIFTWGDRIADREGGDDAMVTGSDAPVSVGQQTGRTYRRIPPGTNTNPHGGKNSQEVYDHSEDIFETGTTFENTLSVSGGGENGTYYLSLSNSTQDGIILANSNYERTTVRLNAERNISDRLRVTGIANYARVASDRVQQGSNISGLMLGSLRQPPGFFGGDYRVDYYPQGRDGSFQEGRHRSFRNPLGVGKNPGYDNPRFTANENLNNSQVDRITGKVSAEYDPLNWLNLVGRVGLDTYTDRRQIFFPPQNSSAPNGSSSENQRNEFELTADLIGRASHDFGDAFGGTLTVGTQLSHEEFDFLGASLDNFSNPVNVRSLNNAELANVSASTNQSVERRIGIYSEADFDFYDQVFVKLTGRLDNTSTFGPEADNSFFYPSASVAWQFSEIIPENDILSFGKVRANYGKVGREPDPYLAFTYFESATFFDGYTGTTLDAAAFGGGFQRDERLASPGVIPERLTEFEIGADLRFFNDRLSLGATYYDNYTESAIFDVDLAPSTGFTQQTQNAAEISNRGLELTADATWISTENFDWNTYANWSSNENTVESLSGVNEVALEGFTSMTSSLVEGEPFGVLYGTRWRRAPEGCDPANNTSQSCEPLTEDEQNQGFTVASDNRVIGPDGFPVEASTDGITGDPNPDWTAGIGNTLRYKGLSLDFLFDIKRGGDVWNGTKGALYFFGTHGDQDWTTTLSAEEGQNINNYLGLTVQQMIDAGLYPQTFKNDDGTYTVRGYVEDFGGGEVLIDQSYFWSGPGSGFTGAGEQFVEDGSFVRLREATLSYNWQGEFVERIGLSSVDLSVTGRNLLLFTDYSGIDPETNLTGPSNGQGLDYFNNPNTRSYRFTVRLNY